MGMLPRRIPAHAGDVRLVGWASFGPPNRVENVPIQTDRDVKVYLKDRRKSSGNVGKAVARLRRVRARGLRGCSAQRGPPDSIHRFSTWMKSSSTGVER